MRRVVPWMSLLILIPLVACGGLPTGPRQLPGGSTPTLSSEEMQTQIAQILTQMPTNPGQVDQVATPTVELPTVPVVETATLEAAGGAQPTETLIAKPTLAQEATATQAPQATATQVPTATTASAATATSAPSPVFTPPAGDPRTRLGTPTSTDPMDNATTWIWPTGSDKFTSGSFSGGKMQVTALSDTDGWRLANPKDRDFGNLYLEGTFQTNTCSGSDHYGMIVRVPAVHESNQGYLFGVTCDGRYSLRRWNGLVGAKGEMKWLVNWTASSAIDPGSNKTNRLGIFTAGSRLILYANGTLLTEVQDATFNAGYFGVFVGSDVTNNLRVDVDEMSFWENPQP